MSVLKYSKHKQKQREYLFKYNPRWNFKREKRKEKHFKTKHCQRHGAFYKATTFRPHQKFFPQSWSQISFRISTNLPTSFKFSTKLHLQNSIWKYQLNFSLKILTKNHPLNLDQTSYSKSWPKFSLISHSLNGLWLCLVLTTASPLSIQWWI